MSIEFRELDQVVKMSRVSRAVFHQVIQSFCCPRHIVILLLLLFDLVDVEGEGVAANDSLLAIFCLLSGVLDRGLMRIEHERLGSTTFTSTQYHLAVDKVLRFSLRLAPPYLLLQALLMLAAIEALEADVKPVQSRFGWL